MICLGIKQFFVVDNPNRLHLRVKSNPNFQSQKKQSSSSRVLRSNQTINPISISMAKSDPAGEIMLTSGASGRVTALLSMQVLKSLLMLVNAFFLLLFFPFRGRKRCHPAAMPLPEKEEKQDTSGNRKAVMRVPSTIVPWKSSASSSAAVAVAVDHEVAVRRALAIRKVTDGGDSSRRDYSLFVTARGETMFTQSWTPILVKTRALVVLLHGLNEHRYDEFAKQLNAHGYKVYGMDWVGVDLFWMPIGAKAHPVKSYQVHHYDHDAKGHGGSDGLHAYVHSLDDAVHDMSESDRFRRGPLNGFHSEKAFMLHVLAENPGLPCFCFGHSTGGAIVLKAALDPKVEKSIAGVVLTSPAVGVQPSHPIFLLLAPVFSLLLPKFQFSAANKKGTPVSRDPAALIAKYSDPLVYTGSIRVRTGHEILKITSYLQQNSRKLKVPFFVLHGAADTVTDPDASLKLYKEASSEDKTIKLLPGCLHDLLFEPEREEIKREIIDWLSSRV